MKKLLFPIFVCSITLFACNNEKKSEQQNQDSSDAVNVESSSVNDVASSVNKIFDVESGFAKYINNAAGQELIREWWFDEFGQVQYEESYLIIGGAKHGSKTLIRDGYNYTWDLEGKEGRKTKYYMAATDYENVSDREVERYGIKKLGYENFLGKNCLKVSMEKPAKSTVWVWNKIPLKTVALYGGNEVVMEAIEIEPGKVDAGKFDLPKDVVFVEAN